MEPIQMFPDFPEEDFRWLNREAARRHIEIKDIINELMEVYYPRGVVITRVMNQREFTDHFAAIVRDMVYKAHLAYRSLNG